MSCRTSCRSAIRRTIGGRAILELKGPMCPGAGPLELTPSPGADLVCRTAV